MAQNEPHIATLASLPAVAVDRIAGIAQCTPDDLRTGRVALRAYREEPGERFYAAWTHPVEGRMACIAILRPAGARGVSHGGPGLSHVGQVRAPSPAVVGGHTGSGLYQGMTLKEFAELAGVDHRTISRHLIEIGTGPAPPIPVGKIPVRRIGTTRRIFLVDIFGTADMKGGSPSGGDLASKTSEAAGGPGWRRSVRHLLDS